MQSDFQLPNNTNKVSRPEAPKSPTKASLKNNDSKTISSIDSPKMTNTDVTPDPLSVKDSAGNPADSSKEPDTAVAEYSQEELLSIFDEIIFSGEYKETTYLRNKLRVTFRTRTAEELDELQRYIDGAEFKLVSSVEQFRQLMNLAYALVEYGSKNFAVAKFEEKMKFIKTLPGPLISGLMFVLAKFDNKVFLACKEGEINF